jgi:hypothetical protein
MAPVTSSPSQRQSFISDLEVPEVPKSIASAPHRAASLRGGEAPQTFVNAGSLVSFVAGIASQNQIDVLNSTMLAQIAADKKFDREQQTIEWLKFYRDVLEQLGWVAQEWSWNPFHASGNETDVDKAVLTILAAIATQNELMIIKAAIDAAKALPDGDGRITLFDHYSAAKTAGCFQIGIASEQNGAVALKMGSFRISSSNSVTKILWFRYSMQNTDITQGTMAATLNTGIYNQLRATVEQKLGDRAKLLLAGLDV